MKRTSNPAAYIDRLETRTLFSTYYVSPLTGSDANNGLSPRTPWQTLNIVDTHTFKRGDRVLLTGTFTGQSLTVKAGITVSSYTYNATTHATRANVAGAATLTSVTGDGIVISASNVTVEDLILVADPAAMSSGNYNDGIHLLNQTSVAFSHETINNVQASSFAYAGLCAQGWNTSATDSAGFFNVLIENSAFSDNGVSGIFIAAGDSTGNNFQPEFPAALYLNSNVTIKNCQAYNNAGFNAALTGVADGDQLNQGNNTAGGIFVSSVNGALVENSSAYNNNFNSSGSVGIWAFDATRVVLQNDDSFDNKTTNGRDGDGFDFDHGVTHSVMQRDFSHGNDGFGFLLTTFGGTSNNVADTIRYCASDDDGQYSGASGICVLGDTVPVTNASIYNNTILAGSGNGDQAADIVITDETTGAGVAVLDNIFYTTGGDVAQVDPTSTANVRFDGNDYFDAASPAAINLEWGSTTYTTLAAWAAASDQETLKNQVIGHSQDPMLVAETVSDLPDAQVGGLALTLHSPLRRQAIALSVNRNRPYGVALSVLAGNGGLNLFNRAISPAVVGAG